MNLVHQNINYVLNKDDKKKEYVDDLLMEEDVVHLIKHIELEYDVELSKYLKQQLEIDVLKD
jgi:hypothetical protein